VAVPLIEMAWHNGHDVTGQDDWMFLWDEYTWSPRSFPGMSEEGEEVNGASFGIGAAVNCFFPLTNTEDTWTAIDNAGLHRSTDPGVGAFSPYYDRRSLATKQVRAGEELFVDYGYDYFLGREELYGPIPLLEDYDTADALLRQFVELVDDLDLDVEDVEDADAPTACNTEEEETCPAPQKPVTTASSSLAVDLFQLVDSMVGFWNLQVHGAIAGTTTYQDCTELLEAGGTGMRHYNRSIRSVEWLEEHGQCMDNIRPGDRSTIPQAGRGAFANRFIAAGGIVAPTPLIHIADRGIFTVYDSYRVLNDDSHEDQLYRDASNPIHDQLMLNYCFGHRHSTLLLCPYGVVTSLINHSSDKPNTRIEWSDKATRHKEWFEMPVDEWSKEEHAGLAFDFVAIRDINEDEEILIDYGEEWEAAWQEHVAAWEPPEEAASYRAAYDLDADLDLILSTVTEEAEGSYGYEHDGHVKLLCREAYRGMSGLPDNTWDDEEMYTCRVVDRFQVDGETLYMAEIYEEMDDSESKTTANVVTEVLFAVPRDAFCFEDSYYSRDHAQVWSLRHDMRIPDDLMPAAWKNLLD
jgi:hypothetical protein